MKKEELVFIIKWDAFNDREEIKTILTKARINVKDEIVKKISEREVTDLLSEEHIPGKTQDQCWNTLKMGQSCILLLEGTNIFERVKKLVGKTNPTSADKDSLRARFGGRDIVHNGFYYSKPEYAKKEKKMFFEQILEPA